MDVVSQQEQQQHDITPIIAAAIFMMRLTHMGTSTSLSLALPPPWFGAVGFGALGFGALGFGALRFGALGVRVFRV